MEKKIIHVDMDAFFAAVEQQDYPKLKGKPVVVGGNSHRGIVATCSYEARSYGIHSAMPIFMAKQRCPDAVYLPVRYERYKEVSRKVFSIFYSITDLVEPLSIDEAYLDITHTSQEPIKIASFIKKEVLLQTGLTLSIGISYNKFLAKLASDWNKPNGIKTITKDMVPDILKPLSIKKVYGIGKKSADKLNSIGIDTIEDLMSLPEEYLIHFLGKMGTEIYQMIRGVDHREVQVGREAKSIGRETTLQQDTRDKNYLKDILLAFSKDIGRSLERRNISAKTITIKYKLSDFSSHTRSKSIHHYFQSQQAIYTLACDILEDIVLEEDLRLIGLSVSNFSQEEMQQLSFFD
ncbi:DNA polymerase-4 [Natronincola peptidivorans]|uniref:DNA polymerase IV n=1 Tax=Natronincola peptidivorans TaxID=426128 RepID=A0A1I0BRP1_9FIRM|nr:DNA polymerase IV [Natronincola peptidivorans]SET09744.1 DNA polymerase-4 [Natronincola peptidivorans]